MSCESDICSERANQLRSVMWSLRELIARREAPSQRERFEMQDLAALGVELATQLREELALRG